MKEWEAFLHFAVNKVGATKLSENLVEFRGLRFCANGTITVPTYSKYGTVIGQKTIGKDRSSYQMFLIIRNLTAPPEEENSTN